MDKDKIVNNSHVQDVRQITSIDDFFYYQLDTGGYNLKAQVVYRDLKSNEFIKKKYNVNLLYNKVAGFIVDENDKVLEYNSDKNDRFYIVNVPENSLKIRSQKVYNLLGYRTADEFNQVKLLFEKDILDAKQMHKSFVYSNAHKIPSNIGDSFDYYLIPSYEILRFFFLKGSKLTNALFSLFVSEDEKQNKEFNDLYLKINDKDIYDKDGEKTAFLLTKEGLLENEVECLFRIAYLENAYRCVELLKESFLKNSNKIFYSIKTILPQDSPFKMSVAGTFFEWGNTKYCVVSQIYDSLENFPYSKIEYRPFVDHRKNKMNNTNSLFKDSIQKRTASRASRNANLIQDKLGNKDEEALVDISLPKTFFFKEKVQIKIEKLDKDSGADNYSARVLEYMEKNGLSVENGIDKDSKIGRGRTDHGEDKDRENVIRRDVFLKAINTIADYQILYFNTNGFPADFQKKQTVLNQKFDKSLFYNLIICELFRINQMRNEKEYFYIIRADSDISDTSRYAVLRTSLLSKIDPKRMFVAYRDIFSKDGVNSKKKIIDHFRGGIKYSVFNQASKNENELRDKIKNELDGMC